MPRTQEDSDDRVVRAIAAAEEKAAARFTSRVKTVGVVLGVALVVVLAFLAIKAASDRDVEAAKAKARMKIELGQ